MKATEQTIQQIERAMRKVADKFPTSKEASMLTDIHIRVDQETGEMTIFDDDDKELTRCVVEQWMGNTDDHFYNEIAAVIQNVIKRHENVLGDLAILKPYSFVLEDEDRDPIQELYLADDDTVIIDPLMMQDLDQDLDRFLDDLLKD